MLDKDGESQRVRREGVRVRDVFVCKREIEAEHGSVSRSLRSVCSFQLNEGSLGSQKKASSACCIRVRRS